LPQGYTFCEGDRHPSKHIIRGGRKMKISPQLIKYALKEVLAEERNNEERNNKASIQPIVYPPIQEEQIGFGDEGSDESHITTLAAIDCFSEIKADLRLKSSTEQTNLKRLKAFAATFEFLPLDGSFIRRQFLSRYNTKSPRYQRNIHDTLVDFYNTIIPKFHLTCNPMDEIRRPTLNGSSGSVPHPLNSEWLPRFICGAETDTEVAAIHIELGAG
jgi:hypothetical protein